MTQKIDTASHRRRVTTAQTLAANLLVQTAGSCQRDAIVPIPAVLPQNSRRRQKVTLYVWPAAWGMWTFYQLSDKDRRQLVKEDPLLNALSQAAQQRGQSGPSGQINPLTGQRGSAAWALWEPAASQSTSEWRRAMDSPRCRLRNVECEIRR
jgi:hypothetical protein